ncbi:MAG TPA: hypothetical protein PLW48_08370 [Alphaproteobacteria bacterium]|nr:hypothetical protein [Rhodospirillaceae bacterium]HRJ67138.1 hypothetical protein [Alphaproteobacteria bacterium]
MKTSNPQTAPAAKTDALRGDVMNVLSVLDDFSNLLQQETGALRKNDFDTVEGLQAHKRELAKRYHDMIVQLAAEPKALLNVEPGLRDKLVRARTDFTRLLQENLSVLENVKKSTQRLVDKILDAARQSVTDERHHAYAASGKAQAARSTSLSLSLDQSL